MTNENEPKDKNSVSSNFLKHLEDLRAFKSKYGHVQVPRDSRTKNTTRNYDNLSRWIRRQRTARRRDNLSRQKIKLLNDIGFPWVPKTRVDRQTHWDIFKDDDTKEEEEEDDKDDESTQNENDCGNNCAFDLNAVPHNETPTFDLNALPSCDSSSKTPKPQMQQRLPLQPETKNGDCVQEKWCVASQVYSSVAVYCPLQNVWHYGHVLDCNVQYPTGELQWTVKMVDSSAQTIVSNDVFWLGHPDFQNLFEKFKDCCSAMEILSVYREKRRHLFDAKEALKSKLTVVTQQ